VRLASALVTIQAGARALRRPSDFSLLWSSSAISQIGNYSVATTTPWLALHFGASPVVVGWLVALGSAPGLVLHLPAGLLVDRWNRWNVMRASQVMRVLTAIGLILGLCFLDHPTRLLILATMADGTATAFYNIAEITAVRDVVARDALGNAMARNEARQQVARVLGRPAGGFLFGVLRWLPCGFSALTSLISIGITTFIIRRRRSHRASSGSAINDPIEPAATPGTVTKGGFRSAVRLMVRNRFLWATITACCIGNFFFQTIILLLYMGARDQHLSSSNFGLLLAASGAFGVAGAFLAPRLLDLAAPRKVVIGSVWAWLTLIIVVASFGGHVTITLVAWGACSFMGVLLNVALTTYLATAVPGQVQGRVWGIAKFIPGIAVPLGALSSGYIVSVLTPAVATGLVWVPFAAIAVTASLLLVTRDIAPHSDHQPFNTIEGRIHARHDPRWVTAIRYYQARLG
jgi:MFS family permease